MTIVSLISIFSLFLKNFLSTDYKQTVLWNDRYIEVEAFSGDNYDRDAKTQKNIFLFYWMIIFR